MSNTREGFEPISVNDAIGSLLDTLPDDGNKVIEERLAEEEETSVPQEAEAEVTDENTQEMDFNSDDEDEADDSEDVEEYDDSEDENEISQDTLYTVNVDGEELEITFDELQKGYQTNRALTQRGQEIAEQRKAFEAEAAEVAQMRDYHAQQLEQLSQQIQQTLPDQEPDWQALSKEYSAQELFLYKTQLDQQKEHLKQVEQEKQVLAQQQAQEQQAQMQKHLAYQREEMLNRIPQWRDEDTRNKERQEVIKYAQTVAGFSQEEVANAVDARAVELLYKAWQWDNLQKKTPAAKKKASQAPKMAKAGQPKTKSQVASRQRQKSLQRLNNERSVDAAVNYLMGN
jgi:hypothetical protein